ncbi:hypothetical protein HZY91_03930 [Facklamia sp. DSM 111018]|uniref:ATPase BadF/BadG/BcrA/BcrD type domain-containing protein n=1 Tax=Facklamia lactis TaxID=2749967 RepID=A0ABS0LRT8_9LACT|nr:acyl-CoA dehydratase activase [Facklamia lactis]MBG9986041.1 hypothetical protein [Facklamia lactis]
MYYIGLDSGSTTTKAVMFHQDQLIDKYLIPTGGRPKDAMEEVMAYFTEMHHLDREQMRVVTTGYGRELWESDLVMTEITCHGRGAEYLYPGIQQVVDIGGQDCKTMKLNGKGLVMDFNMNDRCAAGTGRFVEVMMNTLGEKVEVLDLFVEGAQPAKINATCTVFAESEVISLLAKGISRSDIALGALYSITQRINGQYAKLRSTKGSPLLFTGGLSRSKIFAKILSEKFEAPVYTHGLGQFAGAIGAAKIAEKRLGDTVGNRNKIG